MGYIEKCMKTRANQLEGGQLEQGRTEKSLLSHSNYLRNRKTTCYVSQSGTKPTYRVGATNPKKAVSDTATPDVSWGKAPPLPCPDKVFRKVLSIILLRHTAHTWFLGGLRERQCVHTDAAPWSVWCNTRLLLTSPARTVHSLKITLFCCLPDEHYFF